MEAYTPIRVAEILQRAGYHVTPRQLRDWVDKGALPHPTPRGKGKGKGKKYIWQQRTIVKQAATVCELLDWHGRMRPVPYMLWLLGYEMPLAVIREELLRLARGNIAQLLTGVNPEDYEQLADRLSTLAVQAHQRARRQGAARAAQEEMLELLLNLQHNPQYQPSETVLRSVVEEGSRNNQNRAVRVRETKELSAEQLVQVQGIFDFLQQHLSHARIVEALTTASDAELQAAGDELRRVLQLLDRVVAARFREREYWPEFRYNVVANLGRYLIPWMLTLRREGYGHWLEQALEWVGRVETVWRTDPLFRHALQQGDLRTAFIRLPFFADEEGDGTPDDAEDMNKEVEP